MGGGGAEESGEDSRGIRMKHLYPGPASLFITWIFATRAVGCFRFASFSPHPSKVVFDPLIGQI